VKKIIGSLFLVFLFALPGFGQSVTTFNPHLLNVPVKLVNPYAAGLMSPSKHTSRFKRNSHKGFVPVKKVAPVKHSSFLRRVVKHEHGPVEYQASNMGFEVRRYLHRHKVPPLSAAPAPIAFQERKIPVTGYYLGSDIFDQFAEPEQPGMMPDYSTTGLFGAYSYQNRTYLTFHNAFGARLEFGYLSINGGDVVIDLAFKAGLQYIDSNTDGLKFSEEAGRLIQSRSTSPNSNILPSVLGSIRIGWVQ